MKTLLVLASVVLLVSPVFFCSAAVAQTGGQPFVIRVGLSEALNAPVGVMALDIKQMVETRSNNRIKYDVFPSMQLGGTREMLEGVSLGTLELTVCTPTDLSSYIPQMGVLTFSSLFKNRETAYRLLDGDIGTELNGYAEKAGFKVLGYPEIGFRHVSNSVRPIKRLEDFAGIKIRTRGAPVHLATFRAFGANPVAVAYAELYAALQQRVVDAQENTPTIVYFQKFYEVQKFYSLTNTFYEAWAITMNKALFDKMPVDLQKILTDATKEAVGRARALTVKSDEEYLKKLEQEKLIQVNSIEPKEMDRIVEKARSVYGAFSDKIGSDLVRRVLEAVK